MTEQQMDDLLADFMEWSGGFTPEECTVEQVDAFVEAAAPVDIPSDKVRKFLLTNFN